MINFLSKHPKGLYLLFSVEMWERFSFYGMRALLLLYMINEMKYSTELSGSIYGYYTGLVYLTPLIGGYLADRIMGQRKCISYGAILMCIGLLMLASGIKFLFLAALTTMIIANGFFKSNISTIVGKLYGEDKQLRDSGFTIFYMGINLGAFLSPLVCGTLAMKFGFQAGFFSAGVGMLIGYITYKLGENKLLGDVGLEPYIEPKNIDSEEKKEITRREKRKLLSLVLLMFFSIFFWISFEQSGCSLTLFAEHSVNRVISFNFLNWSVNTEIPTAYFQSFNPLFIITLAPLMSFLWISLANNKKEPTSVSKFCIALGLISVTYFIMFFAANCAETSPVSPLWMVLIYFIMTIAELCLSPIGLSLVSKLAPVQFASLMMGTWFLTSFIGNTLAGIYGGQYDKIPHTTFFLILAILTAIGCIALTALVPVLKLWMGKN